MTEIIKTVAEMHRFSSSVKKEGKTLGLVPTMGYLHDGHISLVREARKHSDVVVVSVFVNPAQFGPGEDFEAYPRDFERDKKLLRENNVDAIFYPAEKEIYGSGYQTFVSVEDITGTLEGATRPGHFRGVTTIVSILFNAVKPDIAVFGRKDAQQAAVIKRMVMDLKFDIDIILAPLIREEDGLAMSSRNTYLDGQERKDALVLYRSLLFAENKIKEGEKNTGKIISGMMEILDSVNTSVPDYARIVNAVTFAEPDKIKKGEEYFILVACKIGKTRLIDNFLVRVN